MPKRLPLHRQVELVCQKLSSNILNSEIAASRAANVLANNDREIGPHGFGMLKRDAMDFLTRFAVTHILTQMQRSVYYHAEKENEIIEKLARFERNPEVQEMLSFSVKHGHKENANTHLVLVFPDSSH